MGVKGVKRPDHDVVTEPGDNARYLRFALENADLPPIDISDPVQVEDRINDYFRRAIAQDLKPTVAGLCNSLGITRNTFADWCSGRTRSSTHTDTIKKAKQILEEMMESYMQNGKINPVAGIFLMSNNFGYKQKVEVHNELQMNDPLEGKSAEELRARYADVIDVDAEEPQKKIEKIAESAEDDDF